MLSKQMHLDRANIENREPDAKRAEVTFLRLQSSSYSLNPPLSVPAAESPTYLTHTHTQMHTSGPAEGEFG